MLLRFAAVTLILFLISRVTMSQTCDNMLHFNGSDSYVDCGPGDQLNIEGQLSVEAWVKLDQRLAMQYIVGNFDPNSYNGFYMAIQNQALNCAVRDSVNGTRSFNVYQVPANTWTHIAFTYKTGGRFKAYINGNLRINVPASTTRIGNQSPSRLIIGGAPWQPDTLVAQGNIDEVRIYNLERSASQIREDMRLLIHPPQSGLIGYWKMAEGTGITTTDGSGYNLNGTLTGTILPAWQSAEGPYGEGTSALSVPINSGAVNFLGTGLSMDFLQSTSDTFVVTQINCSPNVLPSCCSTYTSTYWAIDRYGTLNLINYNLLFSLPSGAISVTDELNPSNLQLLQRNGFSIGNWPGAASGAAANSAAASVDFTNPGFTGQLIVGSNGSSLLNNLEQPDEFVLTLFPNPSAKGFVLSLSPALADAAEIKVHDAEGRQVIAHPTEVDLHSFYIDTENWNAGLYYITVRAFDKFYVKKLLVFKNDY